jgi:hypothetical protein
MVHASNTMWRIKNQASNSTSRSDNALRLLVLVTSRLYRGLQVMPSSSIWGCVLKGCFERGRFARAKTSILNTEATGGTCKHSDLNQYCPKIEPPWSLQWNEIQCEELRIKHLTPLLAVTMPYAWWFLWRADYIEDFKWRLHLWFGVAFWRVVMREVDLEGPNCI